MIAAKGKTHVDVAFWGGVVPGNHVSYVQNMYCITQLS
jgi:dihydroorotase-like cyclic amidohydrolase